MEFKDSICCKCFGCNKLKDENFDFAITCKNFIQAEGEKTPEQVKEMTNRILEKWAHDGGVMI